MIRVICEPKTALTICVHPLHLWSISSFTLKGPQTLRGKTMERTERSTTYELSLTKYRKKSKIKKMSFTRETATENAKNDLAERLGINADEIIEKGAVDRDFPDMSLGAPVADEMSAQMISSGWQIMLGASGNVYEYRADKYQLRLYDFEGENILVG